MPIDITYRKVREKQVAGDETLQALFDNDRALAQGVAALETTQGELLVTTEDHETRLAALDGGAVASESIATRLTALEHGGGAWCNAFYEYNAGLGRYEFRRGARGGLPLNIPHASPIVFTFEDSPGHDEYRVWIFPHRHTSSGLQDIAMDNQTIAGFEVYVATNPMKAFSIQIWR